MEDAPHFDSGEAMGWCNTDRGNVEDFELPY
jgi:hypothetical protein